MVISRKRPTPRLFATPKYPWSNTVCEISACCSGEIDPNGVQPSGYLRLATKRIKALVCLQERLLQNILSFLFVVEDSHNDTEQTRTLVMNELLEGLMVATQEFFKVDLFQYLRADGSEKCKTRA